MKYTIYKETKLKINNKEKKKRKTEMKKKLPNYESIASYSLDQFVTTTPCEDKR